MEKELDMIHARAHKLVRKMGQPEKIGRIAKI